MVDLLVTVIPVDILSIEIVSGMMAFAGRYVIYHSLLGGS